MVVVRMAVTRTRGNRAEEVDGPLDGRRLAQAALEAAEAKKGQDLLLLDMRDVTLVADYFVLMTGTSVTHVDTLADAVEERLAAEGATLHHREGGRGARWILLDYGAVVIHIFTDEVRRYYDLERLWGDAPVVTASSRSGP